MVPLLFPSFALDDTFEEAPFCFFGGFFAPFLHLTVWKMEVVVDSRGGGDWNMEEGAELCARALSLLCAAGAHAREQLRCDSLGSFARVLWHLVGPGAPWIALDLVLCIPC
jgi:hypothetical protein